MQSIFFFLVCSDLDASCASWAFDGWCDRSRWMAENCVQSCDMCPDESSEHNGGGEWNDEEDSVESVDHEGRVII